MTLVKVGDTWVNIDQIVAVREVGGKIKVHMSLPEAVVTIDAIGGKAPAIDELAEHLNRIAGRTGGAWPEG